jgi:chromate reductase
MSNAPLHLVGFSGSLRKASLNTALLRAVGTVLPPAVTFEVAELTDVPLFNGDLLATGADGALVYPEPVARFRAAVARADALLIVSPEYNFSMPAVTKNAIDWASRAPNVLDGKAVAFTGASPGGFGPHADRRADARGAPEARREPGCLRASSRCSPRSDDVSQPVRLMMW